MFKPIKKIFHNFLVLSNRYIDMIYNKETNQLDINCHIPITINMKSGHDLCIKTEDGEIALISQNNIIAIDTVNSKLFFNSRASKRFIGDPEADEYKRKIEEELQYIREYEGDCCTKFKDDLKKEIREELIQELQQ